MDTDLLRKQIAEEVQAEFDLQLRDMRRQKNQLEEEMENAAAKWRAERRRLNDEIERLHGEITGGKQPSAVEDPEKTQEEVEERVRLASAGWQTERERLLAQVSRLQSAVAEAIERSSNPYRATQVIRDQYEAKLSEANNQRLEIEQQLLRARTLWEEEKKTLVNELIKTRRLTPANVLETKERFERLKGRSESVEEARIRELEMQLSEARATILKYLETSMRSAQELAVSSRETQALKLTIAEMKEQQMSSDDVAQTRRDYEARIQDLTRDKLRLEQQIQSSAKMSAPSSRTTSPAPSLAPGAGFDVTAINAEVERVEREIAAIDRLLDDPSTSASTMNQKNGQKSELDAYLRGILFSLGRGNG